MTITGIDALYFGVEDLQRCSDFLRDWGLRELAPAEGVQFECLDGSEIVAAEIDAGSLPGAFEAGSTLRRAVWGVGSQADPDALVEVLSSRPGYAFDDGLPSVTDPNGLRLSFRISRKRAIGERGAVMNTSHDPTARTDQRAPVYERARPLGIGHYVLFTPDVLASVAFYTQTLGFTISDYYPDAGYFLRSREIAGHHQLFLLQTPDHKCGLNHVAFTVRDIHEVFGGGLHISRSGWPTQLGPGRHPISSAYFWYVQSPTGGMFEYYADEDWCTGAWQAQAWERTPEHFAEWAIAGGLDGDSRRQKED